MRTALLVAAALFSTTAFAQSPAAPQLIELDDDQLGVLVLGLSVDQIEDLDVYDAQGTKLGEVEDVLGTDAMTATALVVDLEGVDLDVIVDLAGLEVRDNRIITTLTAQELRALPAWND